MIHGTVDIFQYIVDYVYSYTPGDLLFPASETLSIKAIYEVKGNNEIYTSKKVKETSLSLSVRLKIHRKCQRDGNSQAIFGHYI